MAATERRTRDRGGRGMAPVTVRVWADYVCPFCLLAEEPIREAAAGRDVAVEWMPFELRPYPAPTLRPEDEYLPRVWERAVYPMAAWMGVPIRLPSVSPQPYTRRAFEGYQFAKEHGRGAEYGGRVLRAFFQEDRDIGDAEVLAGITAELGLDADAFRAALASGRYGPAHDAALREARELGITGVPTLVVGGRHRIVGVPRADALARAIEEAARETRAGDRQPEEPTNQRRTG